MPDKMSSICPFLYTAGYIFFLCFYSITCLFLQIHYQKQCEYFFNEPNFRKFSLNMQCVCVCIHVYTCIHMNAQFHDSLCKLSIMVYCQENGPEIFLLHLGNLVFCFPVTSFYKVHVHHVSYSGGFNFSHFSTVNTESVSWEST